MSIFETKKYFNALANSYIRALKMLEALTALKAFMNTSKI